uniref:Protein kinase domain-containing protein n=1 Tax=Maylandia zebra TaxID=106582 RepID=A0A3P9DUM5_9CICH
MWSLGLVAVELATGLPLYPGNEDYDVLKFIIETQGQPPDHVLDSGVYTEDYFIEDKDKQQRWTFKTDQQFQYETGYESLETRCIKLTRLDDLEQIIMFRRGPEVEAFLGEGGFGIVAKCRDTTTNQAVAIKVNKSDPDILQQAHVEIFILEQLRRLDPDAANIVQWNGFFHDGQRVCLKFELLDQCLWDYIGDRNKQGLPISEVRPILGQITNALSHLSSVGIVHADLKPGNIMVVNRHESPIKVKLIDFGLACPASAVIPGDFVGTVGYCAPEVMLGLPYNEASDMWSLGLVAVELATGLPLYPSENDYDYLKFIIETQGQPPDHQQPGQRLFVSLIKQMLALDAHQRITPSQVLRHPFFSPGLSKRFPCINIERPY